MRNLIALIALSAMSCASTAPPRTPASSPLYNEIAALDTAMFAAFNAHDAATLESYFDEGLEFYHDLGGLTTRAESMKGLKGMFDQNNGIRRELVRGSLEVYPIRDYGAIEIGAHRFCHVENGKDDCGTFKFVHVWQKQPRGWKITRVVSYGH
jgi:ketosteroid isomerase-like protein